MHTIFSGTHRDFSFFGMNLGDTMHERMWMLLKEGEPWRNVFGFEPREITGQVTMPYRIFEWTLRPPRSLGVQVTVFSKVANGHS